MSRRIEVEFVNDSCALLRGYQSRELYVEVKGRPPVWAVRDRAWVGQPSTIKDVCALAESRGFQVQVLVHEVINTAVHEVINTAVTVSSDPDPSLW